MQCDSHAVLSVNGPYMNAFCMPSLPYKNLELLKLRFYDYVLTSWVPGLRNVSLLHTDVIHRKKVAMDFSNSVPPGHQEPPFTFSNLPSVVPVLPYRAGVLGWFPPRPVCVWGLHSLHVHEWASSGFSSSLTKKCTGLSPLRLTNPLLCVHVVGWPDWWVLLLWQLSTEVTV